MPVLGRGAVVIWSNTHTPHPFADWHSHEHLPERLGIPGFLRGRRMVSTDTGAVPYFNLYEVAELAVTTSPDYLHCLNNPTEWSRRLMPQNSHLNRTLCSVAASEGGGVAAHLIPVPLAAAPGREDELRHWIAERLDLKELAARPGMTGMHLMLRDGPRARPETSEEVLRGRRDLSVDGALLFEGYDEAAVRELVRDTLAPAWAAHGGAGEPIAHLYTLAHVLSKADSEAVNDHGGPQAVNARKA